MRSEVLKYLGMDGGALKSGKPRDFIMLLREAWSFMKERIRPPSPQGLSRRSFSVGGLWRDLRHLFFTLGALERIDFVDFLD